MNPLSDSIRAHRPGRPVTVTRPAREVGGDRFQRSASPGDPGLMRAALPPASPQWMQQVQPVEPPARDRMEMMRELMERQGKPSPVLLQIMQILGVPRQPENGPRGTYQRAPWER